MAIRCLNGEDILDHLVDLARLRIEVFHEYPYLYAGDLDYEMDYLRAYSRSPESVFVLAQADGKTVGIASGLPLDQAHAEFRQPFLAQGIDPGGIFYFGESVLLRAFRGQGVYRYFFLERENHARSLGRFRYATFCAVERPADHAARPADYRPLDTYWSKRGYVRRPDLQTQYPWRDRGAKEETFKPMVFWVKSLD
ncbi:MAG: GNAT family N-acetyltransferase [Gammaproteobacteria bacterium]|nr:GNAT family N-acetyltransferase [Gammaproteobacteria bacterium]MCP5423571.1 GNAT family N-acetyltransferase [Gammaproteobacteria bacterium]